MPMTYQAGSTIPTSANLTTILALTVANCKPNDLQIVLYALAARGVNPDDAVSTQQTITNYLP